jgi:DNA-binding NarL/FixJ family response regulator
MYEQLLQNHGFRVLGTSSLDEAATLLESHTIDLIVLDLFLSRDDFADSVALLQRRSDAPVLVVAAWMPSDVAAMAMRAGCSLMSKPVDVHVIVRAIRELALENHDQRAS